MKRYPEGRDKKNEDQTEIEVSTDEGVKMFQRQKPKYCSLHWKLFSVLGQLLFQQQYFPK